MTLDLTIEQWFSMLEKKSDYERAELLLDHLLRGYVKTSRHKSRDAIQLMGIFTVIRMLELQK